MPGACILVADDEPAFRRALRTRLQARGFAVRGVGSAEAAVAAIETLRPDVILLDLQLPGIGGLETCTLLRSRWPVVPIIMTSLLDDAATRIAALNAGADDFLSKPFGIEELAARIRVALRHAIAPPTGSEPIVRSGALLIDAGRRLVTLGDLPLHLTPTEYEVLKCLAAHAGHIVPHATLLASVWGLQDDSRHDVLRYTILQLRKKLGDDAAHPHFIQTDPGVGYRLQLYAGSSPGAPLVRRLQDRLPGSRHDDAQPST